MPRSSGGDLSYVPSPLVGEGDDHRNPYPVVVLKRGEERRLQSGHLWVFSNEIAQVPEGVAPGTVADLIRADGRFIARGFYHPHSLIAFRILSNQPESIDEAFFQKRLEEALRLRTWLYPHCSAYRLVFGESDRLPGLIIDRFQDYFSIQILAAGMESFKDLWINLLQKIFKPQGIVWRLDSPLRQSENLKEEPPCVAAGQVPDRVSIDLENGSFAVDLLQGQKTGFYFDQRDNRQTLASLCAGKKVLDAFCYSGAFGIAAGRAGAREIVFADTSRSALEWAQANVEKNSMNSTVAFVEANLMDFLADKSARHAFDVISLDPPAFARSKKHLPVALKAYEKLNSLAMALLPRGGLLASSSCSHHVNREMFLVMLRRAARKAQRTIRLLELRSQSKDHPILLGMPETEYLKFAILQVL